MKTTKQTAARVRILDGSSDETMIIGFNTVAAQYFNLSMIGDFVHTSGSRVLQTSINNPEVAPFISAHLEVSPPLDQQAIARLGKSMVDGSLGKDTQLAIDGMALFDNRGVNQPVHPLDRGNVIEQLLPRDMPEWAMSHSA